MEYLGMSFDTVQDVRAWTVSGKIAEYRRLWGLFCASPSPELSCMLSDLSLVLVEQFGMTWDDVEALEN